MATGKTGNDPSIGASTGNPAVLVLTVDSISGKISSMTLGDLFTMYKTTSDLLEAGSSDYPITNSGRTITGAFFAVEILSIQINNQVLVENADFTQSSNTLTLPVGQIWNAGTKFIAIKKYP